ncbi:MAG: ribosome maturation factor RimM [Dongiaceae bacterium]
MTADRPRRVLLGVVAGAQGLGGELRIKSFTAEPAAIGRYGTVTDETGSRSFCLQIVRATKDTVIARVAGIGDRTAADALRGLRLYVERAALPAPEPEAYYHDDLIGLRVEAADNSPYGTVIAVQNHGAGDILEIRRPDGASDLQPFTRRAFPVVDLTAGRLVIEPPEFVGKAAEAG